ncbi:MAG TPA: hypothetical protein VJ809_13780 [Pirellulales bacterium]|nr:hypothetical protein [Pirellulales bacterium]
MLFDRNLLGASAAVRHLLESRLHLIAAEEAMANVEGFNTEHRDAVQLRQSLDEVFLAVEDRTTELSRAAAERCGGQGPAA